MKQGFEQLFWVIGGVLVLPFLLQQAFVLSRDESPASVAPQLHSIPMTRPAIAGASAPAQQPINEINAPTGQARAEARQPAFQAAMEAEPNTLAGLLDSPVAELVIPSLKMEVPVFPTSNELTLTAGAAVVTSRTDLVQGNNIGVASHRDGNFRQLQRVTTGDLLLLNAGGKLRHYQVVDSGLADSHFVDASDEWEPSGHEAALTLVAFAPDSDTEHYVIRAREIQTDFTTTARVDNAVLGEQRGTLRF